MKPNNEIMGGEEITELVVRRPPFQPFPFQLYWSIKRWAELISTKIRLGNAESACLPPLPPVPLLLPSMVGFIPALTAKPAPVSNSVWYVGDGEPR